MPISEAVKLEREKRQTMREANAYALAVELIKNPVVELVGAWYVIEYLQSKNIGTISGTFVEAAIGGTILAQQLAPIMPDLIKAGTDMLGMVKDLGGALAPAGALAVL
jgi:hypothetical protein